MASPASTLLRRLALRSASKHIQPQLRSISTSGVRLAIATASLSNNVVNRSPVLNTHQTRGMATISAGDALARLATDHPHMEIIRYEHKNVKWTLKHVNYYSDALACGFLDAGLQPGDVVLSWLPDHFAEQVSLILSAKVVKHFLLTMPVMISLNLWETDLEFMCTNKSLTSETRLCPQQTKTAHSSIRMFQSRAAPLFSRPES
jgi:hypothetical protein